MTVCVCSITESIQLQLQLQLLPSVSVGFCTPSSSLHLEQVRGPLAHFSVRGHWVKVGQAVRRLQEAVPRWWRKEKYLQAGEEAQAE